MNYKFVALFMLIWLSGQPVMVLAHALTLPGRADMAVDHAVHCAVDPDASDAERPATGEPRVEQACGLDCQCGASCSTTVAGNSEFAGATSYSANPDTPYSRASIAPSLASFFRPPISA